MPIPAPLCLSHWELIPNLKPHSLRTDIGAWIYATYMVKEQTNKQENLN